MALRLALLVAVFFGLLAALSVPLGRYLARVFDGTNTLSARLLGPVERAVYRAAGIDPKAEHNWREYALGVLGFSALTQLVTYAVLRVERVPPWLAFNTATSFTTNTNWQSYAGESTMSDLAQSVALTSQNFFSTAVGLAVAVALVRGLARKETEHLGNVWVDLVRAHLYVLVPIALVYALFLVSQGVVQTWAGPISWQTLDGATQTLVRGPVASQEAIKMLGTNGGGFFNANSAHPWENPTALTSFVQAFSIFLLPGALCITLGTMVGRPRHGWAVFAAMTLLSVAGIVTLAYFESRGTPLLAPNLEGKELRFGILDTALFSTVTTDASCGAVNAMHDSFTPLGGLVPLLNMQLGEVVFGGVGAGLYGALVYVILTVFLAGLMVGRTPEYLGKKIDSRDVRFASVYILVPAFLILISTALGVTLTAGRAGMLNAGSHGLSEVLYAFTSAAANNGSAFAGLTAYSAEHPVFYSLALGLGMFFGRFPLIVAVLAIAGNMAKKRLAPPGPGSFPVEGALFVTILVSVIVVVGALTFFPAFSLGPIAEHLSLHGGR